jgi:hypothetical protein
VSLLGYSKDVKLILLVSLYMHELIHAIHFYINSENYTRNFNNREDFAILGSGTMCMLYLESLGIEKNSEKYRLFLNFLLDFYGTTLIVEGRSSAGHPSASEYIRLTSNGFSEPEGVKKARTTASGFYQWANVNH